MDLFEKLLHAAMHWHRLPTRITIHVRALPVSTLAYTLTTIELVALRAFLWVWLYHILADLAHKLVNEIIQRCIQYHVVFLGVQHFTSFFFHSLILKLLFISARGFGVLGKLAS